MKKILSLLLCLVLILALSACGQADEESVPVQAVSLIAGSGALGMVDRCAGKVVSGQTANVARDSTKTILQTFVQVGDMVEEGSVLFTYDAAAMELDLEKLQLELQGLENTISSATSEIEELEKQKAQVSIANQLSFTIQIDTKKADIREAEYNKALKEREIANMEKALEATEITAPLSGRVMSVGESAGGGDSREQQEGSGNTSTYITIMDMTSYRVQGNINELNLNSLTVDMPVLIRSRMDESVTWRGTIESIDWENPVTGNNDNNMYYYAGPSDEMTSTSKYPFYVTLASMEGLVLGQHVYVEPDYGQSEQTDGLWLSALYISDADTSPWVWAANSRDKLEKRSVTLGDYNAELNCYLVTAGLELTDYLAYPAEGLAAGQRVSRFSEDNFASGDAVPEDGGAVPEPVYVSGDAGEG